MGSVERYRQLIVVVSMDFLTATTPRSKWMVPKLFVVKLKVKHKKKKGSAWFFSLFIFFVGSQIYKIWFIFFSYLFFCDGGEGNMWFDVGCFLVCLNGFVIFVWSESAKC